MVEQKPKKQPQSQTFVRAAKELGCDEDERVFDEKLKKIADPKEKPAK